VDGVLELWMVGFLQMPHSSQNTQTNIELYCDALKHWFLLTQRVLEVGAKLISWCGGSPLLLLTCTQWK
jgi:hypothetical protein